MKNFIKIVFIYLIHKNALVMDPFRTNFGILLFLWYSNQDVQLTLQMTKNINMIYLSKDLQSIYISYLKGCKPEKVAISNMIGLKNEQSMKSHRNYSWRRGLPYYPVLFKRDDFEDGTKFDDPLENLVNSFNKEFTKNVG